MAQDRPAAYLDVAEQRAAVEPTPMGEGHLGNLDSGTWVQLRFPVPEQMPLAYALNLGSIVGFTGQGSSYRLILRRDAEDGPVIHEGPVIAVGDDWNASNRDPIDITEHLTEQHLQQGYIDIYATGTIEGDGWTVYRHNPGGREITASVVESTPELRRLIDTLEQMRARGVALIPMPQDLVLEEGSLALADDSRIVLSADPDEGDRFAAQDLAEQIADRAGLRLDIVEGTAPRAGDIALSRVGDGDLAAEGLQVELQERPAGAYVATVGEVARVRAADAEGLFYGAQTIAQLVGPNGHLPRCQVADWPSYPVRGLQYDVARGQTVEVDWWKRLIRALGRCKLNMLEIYGEDDYRFEAYPFLGREGTFTPEKARELSEYAHRYHVQLVPQFESLGHASAVLRHEELAHLREAGQSWVFCTSNPETWEFLDTVYGELAEQFPYSEYIHVGGDEFEGGFGKCEACRQRVEEDGIGALYAEHMNRLEDLCDRHGRTMLFWPSHVGWTIEYEELLHKDCIPTEWIYHGPRTYPQIEQYQSLGFHDVWVSPAVVCFSRIWPDYRTTWRGIRGFLQAGDERGVGGCMTTTWEWQHGGIITNSLPGMFYAAECAWSLGRTPVADFERRYAGWWLGIREADAGQRLDRALIEPWPREGPAAICYNSRLITDLWWAPPQRVLREFALKDPRLAEAAEEILATSVFAIVRLQQFRENATRNTDLLSYTELAFRMYRQAASKLLAMQAASDLYADASDDLPDHPDTAAARVARAAKTIRELVGPLESSAETYEEATREVGAAQRDVRRIRDLAQAVADLADELDGLAGELRDGERTSLPEGSTFGFVRGTLVRIGTWRPEQMSEEGVELRFDVTEHITEPGELVVEWEYTRGAHGVNIQRAALLADGEVVSEDEHHGWAGGGSHDNLYRLSLDEVDPEATYTIVGELASRGGTDSRGDVWLMIDNE
ncbi:MAG: beta-N-acetylhexosaminidase [Armatimonadota bacterium]|nr:beta-N-acetylhexosaminidase [Armatimonadota bacterium]